MLLLLLFSTFYYAAMMSTQSSIVITATGCILYGASLRIMNEWMSQNYPTGLRISFFFSAAAAAAAGKTIQFQGYNRFLSSSSI